MNLIIKFLFRLRNGYKNAVVLIIDLLIPINNWHSNKFNSQKNILLVRTDAIGDYVLFRNFIDSIKNSDKYNTYNFFLLGNIAYRELALEYEKKKITNYFWIDNKKLWESKIYQRLFLLKLSFYSFQEIINSAYSRNYLVDQVLISKIKSKRKIGFESDNINSTFKELVFSNSYYTSIISSDKETKFEFDRNKEFFQKFLNISIGLDKPSIHFDKYSGVYKKYKSCLIIFPGASQLHKQWGVENFSELIRYLLLNDSRLIVITGSKVDIIQANKIIENVGLHTRLINLTGQTKLTDLAELLSEADLLISNDTVAVHLAAAVGTKVISILNGQHYGRFCPYPDGAHVTAIYPPDIEAMSNEERFIKYRYDSDLDIKTISPKTIIKAVKEQLN